MEELIEFVMGNFVFIAIVIGIIYQLIFRKSPLEKRNRMPDFGGGQQRPPGSPPQRGVPMRTPKTRQTQSDAPQVRTAPPPEPKPELRAALIPSAVDEEDAYATTEYESEAIRPRKSVSKPTKGAAAPASVFKQPTRDELARAIVWAEVLGPPRAKRPYRGGGMNR